MRFLTAVLAVLLCTCAIGSHCQGAAAAENDCLFKGDDPRLDQSVSFDSNGLRLAEAFASLGKITGVSMVAGVAPEDWMVYDRKVIVHVKNMKLRDLMLELSRTLSFTWARYDEDETWAYRLWRDPASETNELALRTAAADQKSKVARQKRESGLSDLVNLASLSSADVLALKDTDPWRYILASESLGGDVAHFLKSHPESREAFLSGAGSSTPVAAMPADLKLVVRRIADSYHALTMSIGASEDQSDLLSKFDRLQITINRRSLNSQDVFTQSMLGSITIGYGMGPESIEVPILDPTSPVAGAFGAAVLKLRSGANKQEVAKQLQAALKSAADTGSMLGGPRAGRDITSDPQLRTPVELFKTASTAPLTATLAALADKTKLNVVSDYFPVAPSNVPAGSRPLGEQLEIIRATYGSNWEKAGGVIRLRDSEWFRKRTWEVPQVWLDHWEAQGRLNDGLGLVELAQIGRLRDEQLDNVIIADPALVRLGAGEAVRNRQILRFYQSLDDAQRTQLTSQQLPVSILSGDQWARLKDALATKGAAYAAVERGGQSVKLTKSGGDVAEYIFSYYPEGGDPPVTFKMTTGVVFKTADEVILPQHPDVINVTPQPK
jgi:hypothetical protein